ncbi:hypothetical protein ACFXNW_29245 [Nocardia sp. NPDC059180]|uniref:hypothetical protein n=1 Tax=Nocardia sp. NPDC059180 TaxID=3346761 RepID=UPI0036CE32E3
MNRTADAVLSNVRSITGHLPFASHDGLLGVVVDVAVTAGADDLTCSSLELDNSIWS